jgi:hypothetical protein
MTEEKISQVERPKMLRALCGVLWFIPIYLAVQITVGAIVGGVAGAGTQTYDAGYVAGQAASVAFFQKYGVLFLLGEIALTVWLSVIGVLPGTGKWKKA